MATRDKRASKENVAGPADTPSDSVIAEPALPQGADLFRSLFLAHPDGVALVVKGRIALVNNRLAEMSGYSTQEAIGMMPSDMVVEEDKDRLHKEIEDLHKQGPAYPSSYTLLCKDGSRLPIDAHVTPFEHNGETVLIGVLRDLSEQRKAEEAGRESREHYRTLFQAHPDGVALVIEGKIALSNERFAEMTGYSAEEAIGMAPSDMVAPEVRERVDERIHAQTAGDEIPSAGYSLIRKDGSTLPVDVHSRPIQFDGKAGILTVMRDITERKQAEEAQHASDARYRTLYEVASDAFLSVHVEGQIIDANVAAAELLGYTLEELKEVSALTGIMAPEVEEATMAELTRQLQERDHFLVDTLWLRKDGSRVPVAVSGKPLTVDGQNLLQLIGRDITERKQAEEALRALEDERYRRLLEVAPDGIVIVDDAGLIETVNAQMQALFGYDRKELLGRPVEMLMPERHRQLHPSHRQAYTAAPHARPMGPDLDLHGMRKDGSLFPIDVSLNTMRTADGVRVIAAVRDITERVVAERALRDSETTNRALLEAMPDMIFRMARDGTYLGFVPGSAADPVIQPAEFTGKNVRDVLPDIADDTIRTIERALDTRQTQTLEYELDYGDEVRSFESRVNASGDNEVLVIVRDVTERVSAEKTLRDSEARFSTAFHDNPVPVAIARMVDGKLVDVNDTLLTLVGLRRSEVVGHTAVELGVVMDPSVRADASAAVEQHDLIRDVPARIRKKDGEFLEILMSSTQIEVDGEACRLTTFVDITRRSRLEEDLRNMRDDLDTKVKRKMAGGNPYKLTFREFTVLHLIADGKADKEIAVDLGISIYTVHRHVSHILAKMDSPSRTDAGTRALREGLLE